MVYFIVGRKESNDTKDIGKTAFVNISLDEHLTNVFIGRPAARGPRFFRALTLGAFFSVSFVVVFFAFNAVTADVVFCRPRRIGDVAWAWVLYGGVPRSFCFKGEDIVQMDEIGRRKVTWLWSGRDAVGLKRKRHGPVVQCVCMFFCVFFFLVWGGYKAKVRRACGGTHLQGLQEMLKGMTHVLEGTGQ